MLKCKIPFHVFSQKFFYKLAARRLFFLWLEFTHMYALAMWLSTCVVPPCKTWLVTWRQQPNIESGICKSSSSFTHMTTNLPHWICIGGCITGQINNCILRLRTFLEKVLIRNCHAKTWHWYLILTLRLDISHWLWHDIRFAF